MKLRFSSTLFLILSLLPSIVCGANYSASSCSCDDVATAIASASDGDTIVVPSGNCSWSGLSINKAITLQGAGIGKTNITLSGNNIITKQPGGIIRITGFSFSKTGGGNKSKGFTIRGPWQNAEPVIIEGNEFTINESGLFLIEVAGGVIIANNSFKGDWDDSFIQAKEPSDSGSSWGTPDTMGTRDTTGKLNIYIESNKFYGGTNQGIDADDSTRVVFRYNDLTYSSFNSHGMATSPVGVRHWEVYGNTFHYPGGTDQIANQNWCIWIRGGTGVIANNYFDDIAGWYWGNKPEARFSIRGAEDCRPQGSCQNVRYPVPHQLGQNYNGESYFTDPIYIWGNTGTFVMGMGWSWGNPCGLTFSEFFKSGRDYVVGTPKPGYTAFPYPHPLVAGHNSIAAPSNLRVLQ